MWCISENKNWEHLEEEFDWVADMSEVPQDPVFHAEGNVAIHTRMVIEELIASEEYLDVSEADKEILFAAALLHDVEKRSTTFVNEKGEIRSPKHAKKGEHTARDILYRNIPTPFFIREQIAKLVRYHGWPIWMFYKNNPQKKLFACSMDVNVNWLYLLSRSDVLGRISKSSDDFLERVELFKEYCIEQNCWTLPRQFETDWAKFNYFHKENVYPDYIPFDDTKCEVIMMCGFPGVGKDTFIRENYPELPVVSLDEIRREMKISPRDSKAQGKVAHIAKDKMKAMLAKGISFVFNATNITRELRKKNIDLFTTYKAKTKIVYLEVPYKELLKRNRNREEVVPLNVIHRMIRKFEMPSKYEACTVEYHVE